MVVSVDNDTDPGSSGDRRDPDPQLACFPLLDAPTLEWSDKASEYSSSVDESLSKNGLSPSGSGVVELELNPGGAAAARILFLFLGEEREDRGFELSAAVVVFGA